MKGPNCKLLLYSRLDSRWLAIFISTKKENIQVVNCDLNLSLDPLEAFPCFGLTRFLSFNNTRIPGHESRWK